MGKVISLDAHRSGRAARSIAERLVGLGHHADSVRKTVTTVLRDRGSVSMAELCATALRRLEAQRTEQEASKLLQLPTRRLSKARPSKGKERARIASVIRIVAGREPYHRSNPLDSERAPVGSTYTHIPESFRRR